MATVDIECPVERPNRWVIAGLLESVMQALDDGPIHSFWSRKAHGHFDVKRVAKLTNRRHIRESRMALRGQHGEQAHAALLHMGLPLQAGNLQLNMTTQYCRDDWHGPLMRHVDHLRAGMFQNKLHAEMCVGASSG